MPWYSPSFDDNSEEPYSLCVFSGSDLLISHYDVADLDWEEVEERSRIDQRRGLVITQVAVLEDLVDEFILYLDDPCDIEALRSDLATRTIGPRLDMLERRLQDAELLDDEAVGHLNELRAAVNRRNRLAHGTVHRRPTSVLPVEDPPQGGLEFEWILIDRRTREVERISMAGLRDDLDDAIDTFSSLLGFAESFVERAPAPAHFSGGAYLGPPTP